MDNLTTYECKWDDDLLTVFNIGSNLHLEMEKTHVLTPENAAKLRDQLHDFVVKHGGPERVIEIEEKPEPFFEHMGIVLTAEKREHPHDNFYTLDNLCEDGGAYLDKNEAKAVANAILVQAGHKPIIKEPKPQRPQGYVNLSPLCKTIYQHMKKAGSISAREAMNDHGITSGSLVRRICDIEEAGFKIKRDKRKHPLTNRDYTRYSLAA